MGDPQDAEVKNACCPKLGWTEIELGIAEQVPAIDQIVQMDNVIGSGGYSSFQRGYMAGHDSSFAIKCVNSSTLSESCKSDMFEAEIKMVKRFHHPHVCTLHRVIQDTSM